MSKNIAPSLRFATFYNAEDLNMYPDNCCCLIVFEPEKSSFFAAWIKTFYGRNIGKIRGQVEELEQIMFMIFGVKC